MPLTPIMTTLGYIIRDGQALLVHRIARDDDDQLGMWNGLGGKLERGENIAECMRREIREEAGLDVTQMQLRGTISWPGFGKHGEDHFGFVFLITDVDGEPPARNEEGELAWVPLAEIDALPMFDGDRYFLPLVFDDDPRQWHAVIPYQAGHVLAEGVSITR